MSAPVSALLGGLGHALRLAFAMFREVLRALILGFALSEAVQAMVSKREMSRLLPDASPGRRASPQALGYLLVVLMCGGGAGAVDPCVARRQSPMAAEVPRGPAAASPAEGATAAQGSARGSLRRQGSLLPRSDAAQAASSATLGCTVRPYRRWV
jgi:hypothetical protein